MHKTIWLIQIGEPLPLNDDVRKMRTAVLAEKLVQRGHDVVWWASAFDHLKKEWVLERDTTVEVRKGLSVNALKGCGYRSNISLARFLDHRIIARKFRRLAPRGKMPDIIVAATPSYDLAYEAVLFATNRSIPVLIDIRDEWPDLFLRYAPAGTGWLAKLLLHRDFRMIRTVFRYATGLTSMMSSLLDWGFRYREKERTWRDRVFFLGYRRPGQPAAPSDRLRPVLERISGTFVVLFIGTFGWNNDPSILLESAQALRSERISFVLAGNGNLFGQIRDRAASLPNVILPGWLDHQEINTILAHAHIGVGPATQLRDAFPNKAFAYLSAGLPVIAAFHGDWKDLMEEHEAGYYYPPNDAAALTAAIRKLQEDPQQYQRMAAHARQLFDTKLNEDVIYDAFADHVIKVAVERTGPETTA